MVAGVNHIPASTAAPNLSSMAVEGFKDLMTEMLNFLTVEQQLLIQKGSSLNAGMEWESVSKSVKQVIHAWLSEILRIRGQREPLRSQ